MRKIILSALAAIAILAAAWSAFWFYEAGDVVRRLEAWAETLRAQGLVAEYADVSVTGFPLQWHAHITAPAMAGAGPTRWEWRGEAVSASIRPWTLRDLRVSFPGLHRISGGAGAVGETLEVRAARPDGHLELGPDGRLARLQLDLGEAQIRRLPDPGIATAQRLTLSLSPHRAAQVASRTETLELAIGVEDLTVPPPPRYALGQTIASARLDARVKGMLPPGPLAQSVASWREAGGVIEIDRAALQWGPLKAETNGTLTLDDAYRPLGAFTARIRGYTETMDALAAAGAVRPREAVAGKIALNLIARQNSSGARELNVPLTAQDGRLTVAGFPLLPLPPLTFE